MQTSATRPRIPKYNEESSLEKYRIGSRDEWVIGCLSRDGSLMRLVMLEDGVWMVCGRKVARLRVFSQQD